jgi:hypothetical protein
LILKSYTCRIRIPYAENCDEKCNDRGIYNDEQEFNWKFKSCGECSKTCRDYIVSRKFAVMATLGSGIYSRQRERTNAAYDTATEFVWQYLSNHPGQGE